jgi:hypothetical protein
MNPASWNPVSVVRSGVHRWSVESQLGARRNAMVASSSLVARRAERQEVEAFLAAQLPRQRVLRVGVAVRR